MPDIVNILMFYKSVATPMKFDPMHKQSINLKLKSSIYLYFRPGEIKMSSYILDIEKKSV